MKLTVAEVIAETPDARSLVFDEDFAYQPGQFLTLRIPSERTGSVARCYSLASSPHTDSRPKVTVKRTPDGYGSNWICDNITVGDVVDVLPPSGVFTPRNLDADMLLFGAGSGITPIISIVKSALTGGRGQVALFYANRDADSVIFAAELRDLAMRFPDRLIVIHWWESERGGFPTATELAEHTAPFTGYEIFLCGPGPFMDTVRAGLPGRTIHAEVFTSLTGDPFSERQPITTGDEPTTTAEVELDGQTHTLAWPANRSLVDVMLDAGIDVPYSCQEGQCGSCACTLVDGTVDMLSSDILDPVDIDNGYILACQARPTAPTIRIEF